MFGDLDFKTVEVRQQVDHELVCLFGRLFVLFAILEF